MYNKVLGLNEDQVLAERDLKVLGEWYGKLNIAIEEVKARNHVEKISQLPAKKAKTVMFWNSFLKMIRKQMSRIKREMELANEKSDEWRRFEQSVMYSFCQVAKRELPQELYEHLCEMAIAEMRKQGDNSSDTEVCATDEACPTSDDDTCCLCGGIVLEYIHRV